MTGSKGSVGLIGLGYMGSAMAKRLIAQGWDVKGHDALPEKTAALTGLGGEGLGSPAAVAGAADRIVVCVTSTACVEEAVFGAEGIASAGGPDKVLADLSTTVAEATRDMAARLEAACGMAWVDAPVSGGPPAAEAGDLAIMAGGTASDLERLRPLLDDLAARVTLMGPVGAGQVTKMVNQVLVLNTFVILAEALKLAENAGVEAAKIPECLGDGYAGSNLLQKMFPRMVARQYEPAAAFSRQVLKDLDMVYELGKATGTAMPMTDQARMLYRLFNARGHGEEDPIALLKLFDDVAV